MDWTDERIATLRKMWLEGMSASQVARQLGGVSRNAVIGKVHRMGLAGREAPSRPRSVGGRPPGRSQTRTPETATPKLAPVRTATVIPVPAPAPTPAPIVFDARPSATILTLGEHACRWPIGDPDQAGFGFCGARRASHSSYCEGHAGASLRKKTKPVDAEALTTWLGRGAPRAAQVQRRGGF
jgi:GcrA cell cycle regulator